MPPKKKSDERPDASTEGVPVRTFQSADGRDRYRAGVPVRAPQTPEQTAGSDDGQSAATKEK